MPVANDCLEWKRRNAHKIYNIIISQCKEYVRTTSGLMLQLYFA